jgi:hypothetical protein
MKKANRHRKIIRALLMQAKCANNKHVGCNTECAAAAGTCPIKHTLQGKKRLRKA